MRSPASLTAALLLALAPLPPLTLAQTVPTASAQKSEADRLAKQALEQAETQPAAAIQGYEQALRLYHALKDQPSEQKVLTSLGYLYIRQNNYAKGVEFLEAALKLAQTGGDRREVMNLQGLLGAAYGLVPNREKSVLAYQQQLTLARELRERSQEVVALNGLGSAYARLQNYPQAIVHLSQALALLRELQSQPTFAPYRGLEPTILSSLADAYNNQGEYVKAIAAHQQALTLYQQQNNVRATALTLTNLSLVYASLGDYATAIDLGKQQLALARSRSSPLAEWQALMSLSTLYLNVGDFPRSLELSQQALQAAQKAPDLEYKAVALSSIHYSIATGQFTLGNYDKAREAFRQVIALAQSGTVREPVFLWRGWQGVGITYLLQKDFAPAIAALQQALTLAKTAKDVAGEQSTLSDLGEVYRIKKDYPQAIAAFQQSISLAQKLKDRGEEGNAVSGLGGAYYSQKDYANAIATFQQAIAIAQETKRRPKEADALNRLGLALLKAGRATEAEAPLRASIQIQESLRQRLGDTEKVALFDFAQKDAYANLQQVLVSLKQPETALEISERGRARAFVELLSARLNRQKDSPAVTPPTIAQIRQVAKTRNATLVEYSVIDEETLYIWVVQPTGTVTLRSVDLKPILQPQKLTLAEFVQRVRASDIGTRGVGLATPPTSSGGSDLKALHRLLIEPIADLLPQAANDRVIFVPQGALFLVPFAALQSAQGEYLIQKHTLLTAPSIQVLELTQPLKKTSDAALIVGNPTMPRVAIAPGEPAEQLPELPGAEAEARAIAELLKTSALLGDRATKAVVKDQMQKSRLIHLATHGILDEQRGIGSAIALAPSGSDDGLLTAEEILDLKLNAELVVLSACDTGRGKITGDGVIGLSRSLISAGAPSVVVSLWAVPDAPTSSLMTEFYQNLQKHSDKAQALRQAMLTTMQQNPNPRDWAAFTLVGAAE